MIVVPDVHGRSFWKEIPDDEEVVFLGDYLDPYPQESISKEEALKGFKEIIELKKENPDRITLLLGNHDYHYLRDLKTGSRIDRDHYKDIQDLFLYNKNLFQFYKIVDNVLFSHAGVSSEWLRDLSLEYITVDNCLFNDKLNAMMCQVGPERWGYNRYGSIIWRDVREESTLLPEYFHVFGHTQLVKDPIITDKYACVDCREIAALKNLDKIKK
jgi:hypothetical protein